MTVDEIIEFLKEESNPDILAIKESRYGIKSKNALGMYHKELKEIARQMPRDNDLAIALFESGVYEARLLCSKVFDPKALTPELMDHWTATFENWEICDSFCMGLFAKSKYAVTKATEWTNRKEEFEKRAGFATIAAYCMADKTAPNEVFESFFPIIKSASTDQRVYVKKAVNWALRNIGKRNKDLQQGAIELAEELKNSEDKSAQWIANNALKELTAEKVRMSDYPRQIYRKP